MYKAFPYEKTSVRTKLYKCFYVFISYRERISFISDAAPRRLTSKCACGRVLFKSQLLTLGYFCFGYRPVGSYIFFGNRSHIGATLPSAPSMLFRCSKKKDRPPKGSLSFLSHLRKKVSYLDERIRIKSFNLILTNVKGRSIL